MQDILGVTIPYFALVLTGFLAADRRLLPSSAAAGLHGFCLYFALPCLLFRFALETPLRRLLDPSMILVCAAASLVTVAFTVQVTRSRRLRMPDAAFGALAAAVPNSAFLGVPLMVALAGPAAIGPLAGMLLVDTWVTRSVCLALAQGDAVRRRRRAARAAAGPRSAFTDPLPWAILLGALLGAGGTAPSGPLMTLITLLAQAAGPVAMFTIGALLARANGASLRDPVDSSGPMQMVSTASSGDPGSAPVEAGVLSEPLPLKRPRTRPRSRSTPIAQLLPPLLVKLLLHPLLVLLLAGAARRLGMPLTIAQIALLALAAALPGATGILMLAQHHDIDRVRLSRILRASTAIGFASLTLLAWLFGVPRGA